jgi:hypothetical protein
VKIKITEKDQVKVIKMKAGRLRNRGEEEMKIGKYRSLITSNMLTKLS